jgi:rubredoxin
MPDQADNQPTRQFNDLDDSGIVPPAVVATPSQLQVQTDEQVTWWRPSWRDGLRHVGFSWVYFVPAIALTAALLWYLVRLRVFALVAALGLKLVVILVGLSFALAAHAARRVARTRREPFCIFCGYNLSNLPDNYRCPECGRAYTWALIAEYRRDPEWFIERWKAHKQLPAAGKSFQAGSIARRNRAKDGTE